MNILYAETNRMKIKCIFKGEENEFSAEMQ